jgi:hypothetical protein
MMMRRTHILPAIFLAAVFALGSAPSAKAQDAPKWEIFGGYTYMRSNIIDQRHAIQFEWRQWLRCLQPDQLVRASR